MSEERARQLAELAAEASVCTRCPLAQGRTRVVFGVGDPDADLMLVGEAPGYHEDQQGEPFVGPAGKLLDRLLADIGRRRSQVYIANVLKCRPPGNRDPQQPEIDACSDYLRQQLALVDPKVVVTLGNFATRLLLKRDVGISRLRGQVYPWWNRYLVPTLHPAAVLRGGDHLLEQVKADFALAQKAIVEQTALADPAAEQLGLFG
ncbi:MAG TPA: uracil-DNA glycosylase [Acidimicrobiia bacterium]|nr:uracil-DNA glycosylase [Acidimicrobiia bacterium]